MPAKAKFEFRGGCLDLIESKEPEAILAGPRDTGKTVAACVKIHLYCLKCAGVNGNIMRKTNKSISGSVLKTYDRVIKGFGVRKYGGENPTKYVYPNGSTIWIGGMDNADKVLSSERDFIYVNQAEEFTLSDWESCAGSCSGRGAIVRYPQLFGDCNPGGSKHWIRKRASEGKLRLLNARHFDNPSLYKADGTMTADGQKRLRVLENLTGIRRKRYYEGIWATSEGAVYDTFDPAVHVMERDPAEFKRFMLAIDEGYTNPAVILLCGTDSDGRRHVFREFYQRGVLQGEIVRIAKEWFREPFPGRSCVLAAVDAAAAGLIADLVSVGVNAVGGKGRVIDGIQKIQDRLKVQGDGRPRLTIDPSCVEMINEMESYCWEVDKPRDTPKKEHDHCFEGGTLVLTKNGLRPIKDIQAGDYVWCPMGWNKVTRLVNNGLREVRNYGAFWSTPSHKILTDRGLIEVDAVRYHDMVFVWQKHKSPSLTESLIGGILSPPTKTLRYIFGALLTKKREASRVTCIATYGCSTRAKFHEACTFITWTAILATTTFPILSLSLARITLASIIGASSTVTKSIWKGFARLQRLGTNQRKEGKSTAGSARSVGMSSSGTNGTAMFAARNTRLPILTEASSVISTAKWQLCEGGENQSCQTTKRESRTSEVFNLETEHGCYLAGGVLVANCSDAARYLEDIDATPDGAFRSMEGVKQGTRDESIVEMPDFAGGGLVTNGGNFF